jgi:hypothetical protein
MRSKLEIRFRLKKKTRFFFVTADVADFYGDDALR